MEKQETSEVDEVCKYVHGAHTMKFKGQVNGDPRCILMDTGASGTSFIDRKFCKDEEIPLYPAPSDQVNALANNTQIPASDMATVIVEFVTFKFSEMFGPR
jgi:hypothetical protein